jgi:hypothetical protein
MNSVLSALNENIEEGDKLAEILYDQLDDAFISATMYLADLTNILKRLIKTFQLEHLSISHFKLQLDAAIKTIETEFIGSEEILPSYGTIFKKYLEDNHNSIPSFVREYSIAIINAIKNRFPESELYNAFSIFDPKELPNDDVELILYGNQEIEFLGNFYGETKYVDGNEFRGIIDKEELKQEWNSVKIFLQHYKNNNKEADFIQMWKHILDTNEDFFFNNPNIILVVRIAFLIPLSNAHVERIFSQTKLIKNNLRNKMHLNTLDDHLMILLNGPEIKNFDFLKALEHWESKKKRNINI